GLIADEREDTLSPGTTAVRSHTVPVHCSGARGASDRRGLNREIRMRFKWLPRKPAERLARPRGVEPLTPRSVVWCSIQLSYGRLCRAAAGGSGGEGGNNYASPPPMASSSGQAASGRVDRRPGSPQMGPDGR